MSRYVNIEWSLKFVCRFVLNCTYLNKAIYTHARADVFKENSAWTWCAVAYSMREAVFMCIYIYIYIYMYIYTHTYIYIHTYITIADVKPSPEDPEVNTLKVHIQTCIVGVSPLLKDLDRRALQVTTHTYMHTYIHTYLYVH